MAGMRRKSIDYYHRKSRSINHLGYLYQLSIKTKNKFKLSIHNI